MANHRKIPAEKERYVYEQYVEERQGVTSIARSLGVEVEHVHTTLRHLGVQIRPRGKGGLRRITATDAQAAVEMYKEGLGCEAVATAFGVTSGVVLRLAREAGVVVRTKGFGRGEKHHSWAGGRLMRPDGYVVVLVQESDPLYPMAQQKVGKVRYAFEHRIVMARSLGRLLRSNETVHHLDGNRQNNDISNLQLRQGRHGKGVVLCCAACGSTNLIEQQLN